ncbi:TPA: hypothetical protein DCZ39_00845 [Patescibacteria group bacterium]|nr:hypothetical protein [Candidatus Gracilibacteria bacterium]
MKALLESPESGEKYLETRTIETNKTEEEKKKDFLAFYENLSGERKEDIISNGTSYRKRARKYPNIPRSYNGLISLF